MGTLLRVNVAIPTERSYIKDVLALEARHVTPR